MALNLLMVMGGKASRMNYPTPSKPFQLLGGKPIFLRVLENLPTPDRCILVPRHDEADLVAQYLPGEHVRIIGEISPKGIVPAILGALHLTIPGELLIAHADQWLDWSESHFVSYARRRQGIVLPVAMHHTNNAGSVAIDGVRQEVSAIIPKVSTELFGLCGIYWFPSIQLCRKALENLGELDLIQGQHYVENGIRHLIREGTPVDYYPIRRVWMMDTRAQLEEAERCAPWQK